MKFAKHGNFGIGLCTLFSRRNPLMLSRIAASPATGNSICESEALIGLFFGTIARLSET